MKRIKTNSIGARILSGVLSVLMIMSACPTTAFAEYDEPEDKTIVVENSDTETENKDAVVVVDGSTEEDENVNSIPVDEDADDQTTPDVDVPPNITTEATEVTTTEEVTTESTTEKATEATTETVEEELPVVEFDHYFTEIDESLVETSDLIVTTNDASIFTKNTNVVSNFDNAYIISCDSVEEARYVYSYYVDKVDTITDLSKVISVATEDNDEDIADMSDINDGNDALSNLNDIDVNNYAGYIALIDTGANADVNFSVVGDDTSDSNGHGTKMLNLIKAENPAAKVMSIKVFNGSKTDAASVYAGIKLAIESKVSVINLSLVGSNVEKNAIVKDAIKEAIANGITVIGAAGNYNISAKKFIPGCIDDVIVIGAANEDGTKYATSNTDADYYVVAESTSEATAIYTGLYTSGNIDKNKVFESIDSNNDIISNKDLDDEAKAAMKQLGLSNCDYVVNEDGSFSFFVSKDDNFVTADDETASSCTYNWGKLDNIPKSGVATNNSWTGTCNFIDTGSGTGKANKFNNGGDNDNLFYKLYTAAGSPDIKACCDRHWTGDATKSTQAGVLLSNNAMPYKAIVTSYSNNADNGAKTIITFDILYSTDGYSARDWTKNNRSANWSVIVTKNSGGSYVQVSINVAGKSETVTGWIPDTELDRAKESVSNMIQSHLSDALETSLAQLGDFSGIKDYGTSNIPSSSSIKFGNYQLLSPGSSATTCSGTAYSSWYSTQQRQVYRSRVSAYAYNDIYLKLTKKYDDKKYSDIVSSSKYYKLDGTTIEIYSDKECKNKIIDKNTGKACSFVVPENNGNKEYDKTFKLDYSSYAGKKIYVKETKAGKGYALDKNVYEIDMGTGGGSTTPFTLSNIPLADPMDWNIVKISNMDGKRGKNWSGDIKPINATYTVKQYLLTDDNGKGVLEHTWTYITDENGRVRFANPAYCTSEAKPPYRPGSTSDYVWPIGYYEITETAVSIVGEKPAGTKKSSKVYTFIQWQSNNADKVSKILKDGNTWIRKKLYGQDEDVNDKYKIDVTGDDGVKKQIIGVSLDGSDFYTVEEEVWMYLGLFKADSGLVYSGYKDKDPIIAKPQGDATFAGAKYQVFVESPDKSNFFKSASGANSGTVLSFGDDVNSVSQEDGLGNKTTVTLTKTLTPVLVDGQPLYITVGSNGVGKTNVMLPMSSKYRAVEVSAPKGYRASSDVETFEGQWVTDKTTGRDYIKLNTPVGSKDITAPVKNNKRTGMTTEMLYYYGIRGVKKDKYNETGQGNGTTNGIRYAVINKSDNAIALNTPHTTVDLDYCNWTANKLIENGQIVAILTTHTVNNVEGTFRMNGLPYGKYQVVELRKDATFAVGDVYSATSSKAGTSNLSNDAYLYAENKSPVFELHNETNGYTLRLDTLSVSNEDQYVIDNEPFVDGFRAYKMDKTNLDITEGFSSANDIKFAIVNKSTRKVRLESKYVDQLGEDAAFVDYKAHEAINPGEVVAILTTHDKNNIDGYMSIYELRRNVTMHAG